MVDVRNEEFLKIAKLGKEKTMTKCGFPKDGLLFREASIVTDRRAEEMRICLD